MLADILQSLIDKGLQQPKREPHFFVYPSGYNLVAPTTGYNTVVASEYDFVLRSQNAKLESGARRAKE